ncbi:WD40-repeat-containing domain protein [Mycena polygramma]|nr:WD40-repeat-containing domain protein [Mycena polygramma]
MSDATQMRSSLSRNLWQSDASTGIPLLLHSLRELHSVLSLAASKLYIFCRCQRQDIPVVWDKKTFMLKDNLRGHTGCVLALAYAEDRKCLIWSTSTLTPIYVLSPYLDTGAGDLFSLACSEHHTINSLNGLSDIGSASGTSTPRKAHKFFDGYPQYERKPADIHANNNASRDTSPHSDPSVPPQRAYLNIPAENVIDSAHYGYIYCMALLQEGEPGVRLVTGTGDESVKIWDCSSKPPTELHAFECNNGAIYPLVAKDETVYAACQDGSVKVLDLETKTSVRTILVQEIPELMFFSISLIHSDLYACSANGLVQRFSASFDCTASWQAHTGIVLSSIIGYTDTKDHPCLITGGNYTTSRYSDICALQICFCVSIPSVDCSPAAIWLKKCLSQLGVNTSLLPTGEGLNPLVLGTFSGATTKNKQSRPRVLFYGHYDVISAPSEGWGSPPFTMNGRNGYLYGRGVTDNQGPILAIAVRREERCGSSGFGKAVRKHKDLVGNIDAILKTPCITYGLRGVVHCSLEVLAATFPDLHSGIEGGAVVEPLLDIVQFLSTLTDAQHQVRIPGFYDRVRPQTDAEKELYKRLAITGRPATSLSSRWREPFLTVHSIEISGPQSRYMCLRLDATQSGEHWETTAHAYMKDPDGKQARGEVTSL